MSTNAISNTVKHNSNRIVPISNINIRFQHLLHSFREARITKIFLKRSQGIKKFSQAVQPIPPAQKRTIKISESIFSWKSPPNFFLGYASDFLQPNDLFRCLSVCKQWNLDLNTQHVWNSKCRKAGIDFSFDIEQTSKEKYVNWIHRQHLWTLDDVPSLPSNIQEILQGPCPFWPNKTVGETHTLVLIPKTVSIKTSSGSWITKPLTIKTLDEVMKSKGRASYRGNWANIAAALGEKGIQKSSWVLMTKTILDGSPQKSYATQKQLVEEQGYRIPQTLEVIACLLLEYNRSGRRLFSTQPMTYTRCEEKINECHLIVGGFNLAGLFIQFCAISHVHIGVAAIRNLS